MVDGADEEPLVHNFMLRVTIPILLDAGECPDILGTGTLFRIQGRSFIVTAAHILKVDDKDLYSANVDLEAIAVPTGPSRATLHTLGTFDLYRPEPPSHIDVVVIELRTPEVVTMLEAGWHFLDLAQVASAEDAERFVLSGFLVDGARFESNNVGQKMLRLSTDRLHYLPDVAHPEPSVDQFYYLQDTGELPDGTMAQIPSLKGMSGASIWSYAEPREGKVWELSTALKVIAVQGAAKAKHWFRGADWKAVAAILSDPKVGLDLSDPNFGPWLEALRSRATPLREKIILRRSTARIKTDRRADYIDYVDGTRHNDYVAIAGNLGFQLLLRDLDDATTEVVGLSWWSSIDAIKAYAGDDYGKARHYILDDLFHSEQPETVEHLDVAINGLPLRLP